eukprot:scaffold20628_cov31-Tisochrysis_lutea.AAC.2
MWIAAVSPANVRSRRNCVKPPLQGSVSAEAISPTPSFPRKFPDRSRYRSADEFRRSFPLVNTSATMAGGSCQVRKGVTVELGLKGNLARGQVQLLQLKRARGRSIECACERRASPCGELVLAHHERAQTGKESREDSWRTISGEHRTNQAQLAKLSEAAEEGGTPLERQRRAQRAQTQAIGIGGLGLKPRAHTRHTEHRWRVQGGQDVPNQIAWKREEQAAWLD